METVHEKAIKRLDREGAKIDQVISKWDRRINIMMIMCGIVAALSFYAAILIYAHDVTHNEEVLPKTLPKEP